MSEKYTPTPEDRAPENPEPNDEFLSDLDLKMRYPPSPEELASAKQAKLDQKNILLDRGGKNSETVEATMDTIDSLMESEVGMAQWNKLDQDSRDLDGEAAKKYERIKRVIKKGLIKEALTKNSVTSG